MIYLGQIVHGFKYLLRFLRTEIDNSDEESQKSVVVSSMHVLVSKTQWGQSLYEFTFLFPTRMTLVFCCIVA